MGTLPRSGSVAAEVDASPTQVWAVLSDVTRAGEWSHETRGGAWLGPEAGPRPGARFRGDNGKRRMRWSRTCEVEVAEVARRFVWRTVPSRRYPDSTRWTVELVALDGGGTRIVQSFEVLRLPALLDRLYYACIPAHRDRREALRADLRHLGAVAAGEPVPA